MKLTRFIDVAVTITQKGDQHHAVFTGLPVKDISHNDPISLVAAIIPKTLADHFAQESRNVQVRLKHNIELKIPGVPLAPKEPGVQKREYMVMMET